MASINDSSAMSALNEKDYINKLYDTNTEGQKKLLQENYTDNMGVLNQEQQRTEQQTADYVTRTGLENEAAKKLYTTGTGQKMSAGANMQASLQQDNARQKNTTQLNQQQNQAVAEIDRQRQLQGTLYESQIKEAVANNDMQRAQALYEAAKAEDEQYLALRKQAATLMASKGDNSVMESIAAGKENAAPEATGETWAEVLKNEEQINSMYDNQLEAQNQQLLQDYATDMSALEADREQAQRKTDQLLNDAYVAAMQKAKNYAEVQTAYGQGSGTAAQAQLARDAALQGRMTDIRTQQIDTDAGYGMKGFDIGAALRRAQADNQAEINAKRAQALYDAAEGEEQTLVDNQQFVGNQYAKQGNYEMLGKLYGLTADQVDRLMNRGRYAPSSGGGSDDSGSGRGKPRDSSSGYYSGWSNQSLQNMANTGVAMYEKNKTTSGGSSKPKTTFSNGKKYVQ